MSKTLVVICAADIQMRARVSDWGGWYLSKNLELLYRAYPGGGVYPIDPEYLTSSPAMLDLIIQVAKKEWATDACLAGLVRALNDLLDPQSTLCSCGSHKKTTPEKIRQRLVNWQQHA